MRVAIGLTFPGELQDESIICYLCKNYDLNFNIMEASFSMSSGWAFLEVEGKEKEIDRAFEYISNKGIKIQKIRTEK